VEDIRKSKDLGGDARQCHIARICLKRLKDVFLRERRVVGSCLGSLRADLVPRIQSCRADNFRTAEPNRKLIMIS
jgi:hypothetical protein